MRVPYLQPVPFSDKSLLLAFSLLLTLVLTAPAMGASRCMETSGYFFQPAEITCSHKSLYLPSSDITSREVLYQTPLGKPPADGWPVAIIYQGALFPVEFSRTKWAPFGGYYELKTIKKLLDHGYAVLLPRAPVELAWLTNSAGPATVYRITTDYTFLNNVFDAIRRGQFGALDADRKYATGISSGGYNTSRMAVTWPDEFNALVVHSASYATCVGAACILPLHLSSNHPPTKFIHGFLDSVVPWYTMNDYFDKLLYHSVDTEQLTLPLGGHRWFKQSPAAVLEWFNRYP